MFSNTGQIDTTYPPRNCQIIGWTDHEVPMPIIYMTPEYREKCSSRKFYSNPANTGYTAEELDEQCNLREEERLSRVA